MSAATAVVLIKKPTGIATRMTNAMIIAPIMAPVCHDFVPCRVCDPVEGRNRATRPLAEDAASPDTQGHHFRHRKPVP